MFEPNQYRELCSELHVSEEKLEEVIQMTEQEKKRKFHRPMRLGLVAAAMAAMLVVTVSAANSDAIMTYLTSLRDAAVAGEAWADSPVNTEEGVRTGVVGLFKDMTEMERTERMRREYVANISHELRTPLTAVRGLLEPLADGMVKSEEDKQRYYKIMLHEVMRLSRLITDMLTLSRLQAGTEYMELSRVNLEELINDVAMGYASTAQSKGIKLDVDCDHTVDGLTDPDRIEQVLVILIDNAMRYTPEGGSIKIKLRSGERLIISVQDNGCGIPEKDLPHIFERFYKVDKSRGEGGTGLGLSIAKYIMEKLDENITVASELGKGTIFTFTVKKYVSNAIELGPAKESRYEKDRDKKEKPAEKAPDEDGVYDADYEIVHCPPEEKEKKIKFPEVKIKKRKEPKEAGEQKKSGDQKERQ